MKYCFKQKINKNGVVTWYAYAYTYFNIKLPLYEKYNYNLTLVPNPFTLIMGDFEFFSRDSIDSLKHCIIKQTFRKGFILLKQKRIKQKIKNFKPDIVTKWP